MEENKTFNGELEGQSWTSLLIGYVLVLAAIFVAFEWTQREVKIEEDTEPIVYIAMEEDMIPITQQKQEMAPPPAAAPKVAELINIVDDNTDLPEEEVQTTEEVNQAVVAVTGTGAPTAVVAGPPAAVVEEVEDETIYEVVGQQAEFPGDYAAWIQKNLKYPSRAAEQGVQGRVQVKFIVEKDGSVRQPTCLRNSSGDKDLEKEALRVVGAMPKWRPAKQGNKTVRSYFVLPITFRLN